jgi:predicted DNA-binding transcriptional regulator YafY
VTRRLDPLGLVLKAGIWYLVGRIGDGMRTYSASRVLAVRLTDSRFERPDGFDLAAHWAESTARYLQGRPRINATFRFPRGAQDQVLEGIDDRFRTTLRQEPDPDRPGSELLHVTFDWFDEAALAALRVAHVAELIEPPDLRERLVDLARGLVEQYEGPGGRELVPMGA